VSNLSLGPDPTLSDLQQYVRDMMRERSFSSDREYLAKLFMLLVEEVGEFAKATRKSAGMKMATDSKQEQSAAAEAADVLIVLLGLCNMLDIDLEQAFRDKEEKNKQRTWS
jgi:NTP pyrophosphatase (non-canonical NTP hydrolase)